MQEIRNFIEDKNIFNDIKNILSGGDFPWHFSNCVGDLKDTKNFYFTHLLYKDNEHMSNFFNRIASPILGRLKYNYLIYGKVNLFTKNEKHTQSAFHTDQILKNIKLLYLV